MHSILGISVPSPVLLYLDCSDRTTLRRKVLVTPRFSKCHLFMILWDHCGKGYLPPGFVNYSAMDFI